MRQANLDFVLDQVNHKDHAKNSFAAAVKDAVEVGVVVPSILRRNLEEAGFKVSDDTTTLKEYGFADTKVLQRVLVTDKDGKLIAMGAASDKGEALVHAVLGWTRENKVGGEGAPEGVATVEAPDEIPA